MRTNTLHRASNKAKILNALQTFLLLGVMITVGGLLGNYLLGRLGMVIALAVAAVTFFMSGSASPGLVISLYRAREMSYYESPTLFDMAEALTKRADLPVRPRIFVSSLAVANALTVGNASQPTVILTEGLLMRLSGRELGGVLAHEIAHVRNRDLWLLGFADAVRRFVHTLAFFGVLILLINLPVIMLGAVSVPAGLLLLLIGAPFGTLLLELALSRTREFEADRTAVELTGDPEGFASALHSLELRRRGFWDIFLPRTQQHGGRWLRTHPSAEERIRKILAHS